MHPSIRAARDSVARQALNAAMTALAAKYALGDWQQTLLGCAARDPQTAMTLEREALADYLGRLVEKLYSPLYTTSLKVPHPPGVPDPVVKAAAKGGRK